MLTCLFPPDPVTTMTMKANKNAGQVRNCLRCAARCVVAETRNDAARVVSHADGDGLCHNCIVTQTLKSISLMHSAILPAGTTWQSALRLPHIQEQFSRLLVAGKADLCGDQIDWDEVAANWDLPMPGKQGGLF
jgi:hypothetical protein